ncbi:MAG: LuxR C-terminal-related transcriptional regulator, partial [Actinomycetota bacterium]
LLGRETDMEVLGGATTLAEALASPFDPDVIVAEVVLPGSRRNEIIGMLRARFPSAAILMLTAACTPEDIYGALAEGASGYILKEVDSAELVAAVRHVAGGEQHLGPTMIALLDPARYAQADLTPRENMVVNLLVASHLNHEIAAILHLSVRTVEHHRSNVLRKLEIRSRADLVQWVTDRANDAPATVTGVRPSPF